MIGSVKKYLLYSQDECLILSRARHSCPSNEKQRKTHDLISRITTNVFSVAFRSPNQKRNESRHHVMSYAITRNHLTLCVWVTKSESQKKNTNVCIFFSLSNLHLIFHEAHNVLPCFGRYYFTEFNCSRLCCGYSSHIFARRTKLSEHKWISIVRRYRSIV